MRIPGVSNGVQSIRRRRNRSGSMGQGVHIRRRKSDSRRQACGNNYTSIVAQRPQLSGQDDGGCLAAGRFEGGAQGTGGIRPDDVYGTGSAPPSARGRAGCHRIDVSRGGGMLTPLLAWWRRRRRKSAVRRLDRPCGATLAPHVQVTAIAWQRGRNECRFEGHAGGSPGRWHGSLSVCHCDVFTSLVRSKQEGMCHGETL